jgi:Calx-beta domain
MANQKRPRTRDEVTIGSAPARAGDSDAWRLDPSDVARHAQRRRKSEQRSPLARALRYSAVVLVLAGAFAVYWNVDTLRQVTVELPALSALFKSPSPDDARNRASGATGNAEVESSPIVGTAAPTSVSGAHDREPPVEVAKVEGHAAPSTESREAPAVDSRRAAQSTPAADGIVAAAEPVVQSPAPAPEPALPPRPAPPPVPETIGFALPKFTVSERDASAAVLFVRNDGNRGTSVFTWWTSDGTANAGKDYVDLGKVVVKFAAGEENRTIHIPIVGDEVAEGPESFYVNLAAGDNPSAEPQDRVEVVIEDDDSR